MKDLSGYETTGANADSLPLLEQARHELRCYIGDPVAIRDYAQAAEDLGYTHLLIYDHVLGASTANRPQWRGAYTSDTLVHEPVVLFGYLAGLTRLPGR